MLEQPNNDPALLFVQPESIEFLVGSSFLRKKGQTEKERETQYSVEECGSEDFKHTHLYLALFFSAAWCPPSESFLKMLKEFYSEVNIDSKQCEILYVSLDHNEDEFKDHYAHMPWLAIPYTDRARAAMLRQHYKLNGIPQLVVIKSADGALVTVRGRKDVHEQGVKSI